MKLLMIIFSLTLSFHAEAKLASLCTRALEEIHKNDLTANFISYLSYLSENGFLKDTDLENILIESQKQSQIVLPFLQSASSSELDIHVDPLKEYLAANPNTQRFLDWLKQKVAQAQTTQKQKSENSKETASGQLKMGSFYPIEILNAFPKYQDLMKNLGPPKIPHVFEAMPTVVTVGMWIELMGKAPKDCKNTGDQPVTNITWWSMAEFANRLSRKYGLPEVYNFKNLQFVPGTSAEDGNWMRENREVPEINSIEKDIYQAKGYRLPTRYEQFFMIGNGEDISKIQFPPGIDRTTLFDYEWFKENSDGTMPMVATLKPYIIQGHPFYDLLSTVNEASSDFDIDTTLSIGRNFTAKGSLPNALIHLCTAQPPNMPADIGGFRLVRSLPK